MMVCFNIEIFRNLFVRKEKECWIGALNSHYCGHRGVSEMSLKYLWGVKPVYAVCCLLYSCMLPCMMYDACLSINVTMLEVASIWVVSSPLLTIPKHIQVRTQLTRPSTSGWYYPSVPVDSGTLSHCVTV